MSPKEKCDELIEKFLSTQYIDYKSNLQAKKNALIAVDEIIEQCSLVEPFLGFDYWQEVKQEIEKL
jgi:hypothetical protein